MSDSEAGAGGPQLVRVDEKLDVVASKAFEAERPAAFAAVDLALYVDLVGMNTLVREVIEVSGFDRMLTIEPDLATAREQHG